MKAIHRGMTSYGMRHGKTFSGRMASVFTQDEVRFPIGRDQAKTTASAQARITPVRTCSMRSRRTATHSTADVGTASLPFTPISTTPEIFPPRQKSYPGEAMVVEYQ